MMSVKGAVAAAAAALAVIGGTAVAATLPAHAETPSCGNTCVDLYGGLPVVLGHPGFLIDSYKQSQATGTPIVLFLISNTDPAEDFNVHDQGLVSAFFAQGRVSAAVDLHYGDDAAFELEYTPFGAPTGQCVGVAATAAAGEQVTLQPCGVGSKTIWIVDSSASITGSLVPLINGSDTNFADPFVLTYPTFALPTDVPRPVLEVDNLSVNSAGQVPATQLWSEIFGVANPGPSSVLLIDQPANVTVDATGPSGATVAYPLPAVKDTEALTPPTPVCTPPPGSTFPIGTTTVTCTATDSNDFNSPVSVSFTVTVEGAAAQLASLYQAVQGYGVYNILALTVSIAQHAVATGNTRLACQSLGAFVTDARLQLPAASAAPLIAAARQIEAVLAC